MLFLGKPNGKKEKEEKKEREENVKIYYLKMCLLLRMRGHESSAKAPDRTRSSNSFLHVVRKIKQMTMKYSSNHELNSIKLDGHNAVITYLSSCTGSPHSSS